MIFGYKDETAMDFATQVVLTAGGVIEVEKLSLLLYLAEREAVPRRGLIFQDEHVLGERGPFCRHTMQEIRHRSDREPWSGRVECIQGPDHTTVRAVARPEDLMNISMDDCRIIDEIWSRHGGLSAAELLGWIRDNLPECAVGRSGVISDRDMALGVGLEDPDAHVSFIEERRSLHECMRRF